MSVLIVPLVGMHFRPPAKWVLEVLPAGATLRLEPEPENPYDSEAIKVWAKPSDIPDELRATLDEVLAGAGWDLQELLQEEELHLGYIGDSKGKVCKKEGWPGNHEVHMALQKRQYAERQNEEENFSDWGGVKASLASMPTGTPAVRVET